MSMLFQLSNLLVIPFWLVMIALPKWSWTLKIMRSHAVVLPIAVLYSVLVVPNLATILPDLANPTLPVVQQLLSSDSGATTAWIHFLAFDLWTGRWAFLDAQESTLPVWLMSLLLVCIFMVGPFGLLLYVVVRWVAARRK
ncbi:MAG: hypothetical protein RLY87_106 [Chloroflexota bacterium]